MKRWNYENDQWTKLPGHLKHLPLFTQHFDLFSICIRTLWGLLLRHIIYRFYIRLKVNGNYKEIYKNNKKLLIISNHASHLDATAIAASIPQRYWPLLYIAAAKDYFFTNPLFTFFSQHCLGAIPFDRKKKKAETINLVIQLLTNLDEMWMIIFPEGTRSTDGKIHDFKRGVSLFSERTQTPILFLYIEGNSTLWPKGKLYPSPGKLTVHVGPVHPPGPIDQVDDAYKKWVLSVNPNAAIDLKTKTEEVGDPLIAQSDIEESSDGN